MVLESVQNGLKVWTWYDLERARPRANASHLGYVFTIVILVNTYLAFTMSQALAKYLS